MQVLKKIKRHDIKEKQVKVLAENIKNSRTLMIVSVKSLPSKNFQEIKKSVRKEATIKITKKNVLLRAIKLAGTSGINELEPYIKEDTAFALSDNEGYSLAGILLKKKNPVFAKAGQIAPLDIEVKEGITSLVPGPAISELGALGIQISVEDGKIAIKKAKIVVKEGREINANAASILQKLDIKPFSIGLLPVCIYDVTSGKVYADIKIDSEETRKELLTLYSKALGLSHSIGYLCRETIGYFLAKANMEAEHLNKLKPAGVVK